MNKLKLKINYSCNLRCKMCEHWRANSKVKEMSTEQVLQIVDDAASLGCRQLTVTGGEPTLRKDLETIFTRAKQCHMRVKLLTNGFNVSEKRLNSLVASGLSRIGVSLDYPDAEMHDYIRGVKGAFQNTTDFIRRSVALRHGVSRLHEVIIAMCLLKTNLHVLPDIIKVGKNLGVDGFSIITIDPHNDDGKSLDPLPDEKLLYQKKIIPKITEMCKKYDCKLSTPGISANYGLSIKTELKELPCYFTWANSTITANGDVYPCCNLIDKPSALMGNIKQLSLKEIYSSERASKVCSMASKRKLSTCRSCYWEHEFNSRVHKMDMNTSRYNIDMRVKV